MKRFIFSMVSVLVVAGLCFAAPATAPTTAPADSGGFTVAGHGTLHLPVPEAWTSSTDASGPGGTLTVKFHGKDEKAFELLVTALPADPSGPVPMPAAKLKAVAQKISKGMLASAKETAAPLQEVKGKAVLGYFFTVTDKAPAPGSFEYATTGVAGVGDVMLTVTLLSHQKNGPEKKLALDMVRDAALAPVGPAPAGAAAADTLRFAPPGKKWELIVPKIDGLAVLQDQSDAAHHARQIMAAAEKSGVVVSIFLEPAMKPGAATVARDVYWGRTKQSPMKKQDIKLSAAGDRAIVEYTVSDIGGVPLQQKNVNVYFAHDGVWIDVHLSKEEFDEKTDRPLLAKLVEGVRIDVAAKP